MGQVLCIGEDKIAVIERFGKFDSLKGPGLSCIFFPVCNRVGEVTVRVQQLNVRVDTKTRDNVFVSIVVAVQFEVLKDKVFEAFYKLSNPAVQINSYVFDVVRATVPKLDVDQVFESKEHIAQDIEDQLGAMMRSFGFRIHECLIIDIDPDDKVKNAMNEINANRRLRLAAQEKAEADKIVMVKRAEAEAESMFLQGEGTARQRKAIVDGLKGSVTEFTEKIEGMTPKDVLELILITQYFDTLKEVADHSGSATMFLPHNPGALRQLTQEIKGGFISAPTDKTSVPVSDKK
jgi:regulator of protease activity HflC (stomatin/prohibitin superfamily)